MPGKELSLDKYDSDKISSHCLDKYDRILSPWVQKPIVLLELGIYKGGSLLLWRDYFPHGKIVGIDLAIPKDFTGADRINMFEGDQADTQFLSRIANQMAPDGFDIIIDDASHIGTLSKISFWHLFDNHLKPGGLYVIEDWGSGYWDDWPDGKSLDFQSYTPPQSKIATFWSKIAGKIQQKKPFPCHSYGMVGFVKQLIDEQGAQDATMRRRVGKSERPSKFKEMLVMPSIIFITKADT